MQIGRRVKACLIAILILSCAPGPSARASGVGISVDGHGTSAAPAFSGTFWARRPRPVNSFRYRDLEFQWDAMYARDAISLSAATANALDSLGAAIADSIANPLRVGFTDVRLIYDYFRLQGGNYDAFDPLNLASVKLGRTSIAGGYPDKDRSHVDYYILHPERNVPSGSDPSDGGQPSYFVSVDEDTSTGSAVPLHENSMHVRGVADADLVGMSWARTTSPLVWRFNHELQHALHELQDQPGAWSTEMFSAGAEAIGGVPRGAPPRYDVPYTHSLLAFGTGNGCVAPELSYGFGYQQRSLFASYLAYNFRGADTTTVRPADPSSQVGLGDDLLWRWARTGTAGRTLHSLRDLVVGTPAYFSRIDPVAGPTTSLSGHDLLQLLHHNWRVANYLNAPAIGDGRYGYPAQFGYAPAPDVGAWQRIDTTGTGCVPDEVVSIPPKVSLAQAYAQRSLSVVGTRYSDDGVVPHRMVLQPYGAEYWIARSGAMNGHTGKQLVVTVNAEGADRCPSPGRIMASVAVYRDQSDSLWKHPEWVQDVSAPKWLDADSLSGEMQFVVPDFGNAAAATPRLAALAVITLGERLGGSRGSNSFGLADLTQRTSYRVSFDLAEAPFPQPFAAPAPSTIPVVENAGAFDQGASWSPIGTAITYASDLGGDLQQVYRRSFSQGNISQPQTLVHAMPGFEQREPDWSPRGDWIVFVSDSAKTNWDLYAKNLDTGELRRLTSTPELEMSPAFQPNGQGLAYVKRVGISGSFTYQLRWRNLKGTTDVGLLATDLWLQPYSVRWSGDGSLLYYTHSDSIYTVAIAGGQVVALSPTLVGGRTSTLDVPKGAGAFVFEEPGVLEQVCGAGSGVEVFRRLTTRVVGDGAAPRQRFFRTSTKLWDPRISLDGTRVAFGSMENDEEMDIHVGILSYDHAPVMNALAADRDLAIGQGYQLNLSTNATDSDGDPISYKAAYLPPGSSFAGSTFSWTNPQPSGGDSTFYSVFIAYDPAGAQDYRVVRFRLISPSGGGCPFVDVRAGSSWIEGNSISKRDAGLLTAVDAYRVQAAPEPRTGRVTLRIRENDDEESSFDRIALTVVDRPVGLRSFSAGESILQGTLVEPSRVTSGDGRDLTDRFVGPDASGMVVEPGEALLVEFDSGKRAGTLATSSAGGGPTLSDGGGGFTMDSGGKELPPEMRTAPPVQLASAGPDEQALSLTGVDIQIPDATGGWTTVLRHYPRAREDVAAFEAIPPGPVRLAFVGRHTVRSLGRVVSSTAASQPVVIPPLGVSHTRLGDMRSAVLADDAASVTVVQGDTLSLEFAVPPAVEGMVRDLYLTTRSAYRTASGELAPRISGLAAAAPLEFALGFARPNPTRRGTVIPFTLPGRSRVDLRVFDVSGRLVRRLIGLELDAGAHEAEWDRRSDAGSRVAAGIYLYRLVTPTREATRKVVIVGE